jgi:hypothetical protein
MCLIPIKPIKVEKVVLPIQKEKVIVIQAIEDWPLLTKRQEKE